MPMRAATAPFGLRAAPRRRHQAIAIAVLAAVGLSAPSARAEVWQGAVTHVTDGDTVWVRPDGGGRPRKVRLLGIDAPERCQAWGPEAGAALRLRVLHQAVALDDRASDVHGRRLATLVRLHSSARRRTSALGWCARGMPGATATAAARGLMPWKKPRRARRAAACMRTRTRKSRAGSQGPWPLRRRRGTGSSLTGARRLPRGDAAGGASVAPVSRRRVTVSRGRGRAAPTGRAASPAHAVRACGRSAPRCPHPTTPPAGFRPKPFVWKKHANIRRITYLSRHAFHDGKLFIDVRLMLD